MVTPKPFNGEVNEYSLKKKKIGGKIGNIKLFSIELNIFKQEKILSKLGKNHPLMGSYQRNSATKKKIESCIKIS